VNPATRERIKRGLGPLLPPVRAANRALTRFRRRPAVEAAEWQATRLRFAVQDALVRLVGRRRPIRALRRFEFDALVRRSPYYKGRWTYLSAAGRIADELIRRDGLRTALELGPHLQPMIVGADAMDYRVHEGLRADGRVVIHDATAAPWPFGPKAYDLFVALQVFEHLGDRQAEAFREVRRVARHAIISLPIDWVMEDPQDIHHQLSHETALRWFAPVVPDRVEVGNSGPKKRLIYVFENLPA
jgi:hypothetical protein